MLLLAIPMYAAPFVLVSRMAFAVFLAIPRVHRFAVAALVAPMAFGVCAAAGFISWFLVCAALKIELKPIAGLRGVVDLVSFFVVPGVLGSLVAVWIANKSVWAWGKLPLAPSWKERTSAAEAARSETALRHG